MARFLRRLRALLSGRRFDDEVRKELAIHVQMEAEHRQRQGLNAADARRTTLRDFGDVTRVNEEVRDVRGLSFWDALSQDVRFGLRTLRRSPGYTTAAVLILALGIGANTAMFSVISGVLLKPLPFRNGDDIVLVQHTSQAANGADAAVSIPELFDYRQRLQSVRDLVEFHGMSFTLLNQGEPDRVDTGVVSANFFEMLGIRPLHGRTFVPGDDELGADAVLVLSHGYWKRKFGGDPKVIGKVLEMNNRPHTVIGVLPDFPEYPRQNDVYMSTSACPFRSQAQRNMVQLGRRAFSGLRIFGRLSPDATVSQASAEVATVARDLEQIAPEDYLRSRSNGLTGRAASLRETLIGDAGPMVLALTGATLLVLLIACANVANLALARTVRRGRELAVRTALGAGRTRLIRQLITESVLVALIGGTLGLALAWLSLDMLVEFIGRFTPRVGQISIDGGVLTFAFISAVLTGVVFGLAPALGTRRALAQSMRDGASQGGDSAGKQRVRAGLVVAQVGVSFVLLVGAALLLESFYRLSSVPLGYETDRVMTAAIFGNFSRNTTPQDALRTYTGILERLRSSPGIRHAAITNVIPQSNLTPFPQPIRLEGIVTEGRLEAERRIVSDGYFDALGIPLLAGRDVRESDTLPAPAPGSTASAAPRVAVINQSMARYWNGIDPVGLRFTFDLPPGPQAQAPPVFTVIGVVPDFRIYSADREIPAEYYTPLTQSPGIGARLLVRTDRDPSESIPIIKAAVHGVDPQMPVEELLPLQELRSDRLAVPGLTTILLTIFAAVALVITLAGIAGLVSTSVSQRTREFGLRMALGATRTSVLQLVLRQSGVLVLIGIVIGLAGAYPFSQLIARYLFRTTPADPLAYAAVAATFLIAALIAALGPARRATTVDPLLALKAE
jgi:putative ABC transport system permease protein